jgi:hypothetical protein
MGCKFQKKRNKEKKKKKKKVYEPWLDGQLHNCKSGFFAIGQGMSKLIAWDFGAQV